MILQILLVVKKETEGEGEVKVATSELNTRFNVKVAKPPTFNRDASKISGFITTYRLYLRMRMRNTLVEEQI